MTKQDVDNDVDNDDYDDYDDDNYQVSCGFQDAGQPAGPSGVCLVQGISSIITTTIIIIHTKNQPYVNLTKNHHYHFHRQPPISNCQHFPSKKNPQFLFSPVMVMVGKNKKLILTCHGCYKKISSPVMVMVG